MSSTYVCVICEAINHSSRLHCQTCGTTPAMYSWNGLLKGQTRCTPCNEHQIEVVAAHGALRANQTYQRRIGLKTVELSYYAEPSAQ